MQSDETYMARCIELALLGQGDVAPNPMVGAVVVHNGKIIGEGYHAKYGSAHAEVNAINSVKDKTLLGEATIYVSLEPCAHAGKTPPCADLLVMHKLKRVVIGCVDTFAQVSGKGIERLKNAGIDVSVGCLEDECLKLNKHFFTFHEKKRPYVLLKWAQTKNGKIDNGISDGNITWISAPETQALVHTWRKNYQSILVGKNTVLNDNPSLTVRAVKGKNPVRLILDSSLEITDSFRCLSDDAPTWVFNTTKSEQARNVTYVQLKSLTPDAILKVLFERNVLSVLIEGGRATLQSFIDANLWDEAKIIVGQHDFEQGTEAPKLTANCSLEEHFFGDTVKTYFNV